MRETAMMQVTSRLQPFPTLKRRFLELVLRQGLNPLMSKLAGRRWSPWASLHHVGRRSGRTYTTPVLATVAAEGVLIPLPFGSDTDWCRNLLATDQFILGWQGRELALRAPRVTETSGPWRLILRRYLKAQHVT
jgi:deazaflavin-dependent oxidoreductase (nitroreductase family)